MYAIHVFDTTTEHDNKRLNEYNEPWVSYTLQTELVDYNKTEEEKEHEKLLKPLTFEFSSDGIIKWIVSGPYNYSDREEAHITISYRINNGNWVELTSSSASTAVGISVSSGDVVEFKGDNENYCYRMDSNTKFHSCFNVSGNFIVYGNIMSLINSTNYPDLKSFTALEDVFNEFFKNCTGLTSAENLILPVTNLVNYCYQYMFYGCTSLTSAPKLPATTVGYRCYQYMFSGCTSLATAPELPATTLVYGCYDGMFQGCTSLTTAPVLPATSLQTYCYLYMFNGCTSLTTAPELPATTLAQGCYSNMFYGCTSLTTAPVLPATTLADGCYGSMFYGCTSLTAAPELPATTLISTCYRRMFYGCTNLNYIKCLATNISASNCTNDWVSGVASSGTFVKNPSMSSWATGNSGIPTGWTVQDAA